jgi:glucose/mannose-6-phosphate isomerase
MGGSAIGADLLAAYAAPTCSVPLLVRREYELPAWARGPQTLVIATSHSGNTEETLQAFAEALESGAKCLAVTTGGALAQKASSAGVPLWQFTHRGQPRAAVGYSFGLLLCLLSRLGLVSDPQPELQSALKAMKVQRQSLLAEVPAARNLAKRYAGQMMGRFVAVFGAGLLVPVALRWKTQINELAKAWAQSEALPEADHNTIAGILEPESALPGLVALFLRSPADHPRNRLRSDLTRKTLMLQGINTDFIDARGNDPLSHLWTCLHLGDYIAYYLALSYGIDPTPVESIESFKMELKRAG